jgi:hypothetical protein
MAHHHGVVDNAWERNSTPLSADHHGGIHLAGSEAIEPSAVDDNSNDDRQNLTSPIKPSG